MRSETLEQLEGCVWPPSDYDSYLASQVHLLRRKPLDEFTVEDLRIMVGQDIGLAHLMPQAVAVLELEPLAEGAFYPGDLLSSVIGAVKWLEGEPVLACRIASIVRRVLAEPDGVDAELQSRLAEFLEQVRA